MMMFESGIDAILYIAKTLDNLDELEDGSRHGKTIMEPKIPAIADPAGEDSVLYTRRNISESSPSNDSLPDDTGTNTTNISSESENSANNGREMPMEIGHDSVGTGIITNADDIQNLADDVPNVYSESENSGNSTNEQSMEIDSDSVKTKIDGDSVQTKINNDSMKTSICKKTSDIQNSGAEDVGRIQSYSTSDGENSASLENGANEISERTSNHNNISIHEKMHHQKENGIETSVSDSISERGPDSENKLTCEHEEDKSRRAVVHIYSDSLKDSHENNVKENGKLNEIPSKSSTDGVCIYSQLQSSPHCESNTDQDNSNDLFVCEAALVTSSDTKKKCSVNRKIVKHKPYDRKKLNVGVAEEIRKLNDLVQLTRKKNRESRKAKGTNQCNSKQSSFSSNDLSENSTKTTLENSSNTVANTPKDNDKPPPLLVKIAIPRASQSATKPDASVDGTGKRIPKKRTFKEFIGLEATDKQDAKKIRHPWERRPRKKSKEEYRLLREAKKTKREERLRRERMMERQKELDERYLVIEEEGKPAAEPDNDKADKPDDETNTAPHIPIVKRYVLDEDRETNEVLIEIDPVLLAKLKPHQVEAVRFMYDCCIESIEQLYLSDGGGCILAHCMGLGKTLSVISFVYTLMSNKQLTNMEKCLIVCPLNTVKNWVNEFHKWTNDLSCKIKVYELSNVKESKKRGEMLNDWNTSGGVMILGYEMYRNLVQAGKGKVRVQKETYTDILANPGPDLVICDEGHILKNSKSMSYKAMNRIRTRRRVILTGTPLQNNLKEYYHMVNYVKPLLLSTMKNFQQRFIDPIMNGQCKDSSPEQIDWMKKRVHVLHRILGGCVQRKDYSALTKFLPPKHEYVISVRMGSKQCTLYELYLQLTGVDGIRKVLGRNARLFKDYQSLMKIWTHPWLLTQETNSKKDSKQKAGKDRNRDMNGRMSASQSPLTERNNNREMSEEVAELEDIPKDEVAVLDTSSHEKSETYNIEMKIINDKDAESRGIEADDIYNANDLATENEDSSIEADSGNALTQDEESSALIHIPESSSPQDRYDIEDLLGDWWKDEVTLSDGEEMALSGKIVLLFEILDMCRKCGDKLLVFSQSIPSLNLIEGFLKMRNKFENGGKKKETGMNTWVRDKDYFRIDGSTSAQKRKEVQKSFNDPENKRASLFLISTKAGSLGTNLVAANRVIIFDASWNPTHDIQSIFRVYRFGQTKPVYVYRFLAQGTMEEKIYERQVTKQSLSQRVIDEHQIERHFTMADLQALYRFTPDRLDDPDREDRPLPMLPKDELLATLMTTQKDWIVTFHEHDSLLENMEEQELTEEEKKAAWDEYERKALKIFRTPEPEQRNDGEQSQDSVQFANYLQNGDGNQTSYGSLPPIEQSVLDEWFNQPEHTELLNTLRDIIPDVLMEGDQNDDNADNTNNAGHNSYVEQGIPYNQVNPVMQSASSLRVLVNNASNYSMNANNGGAFFNSQGLEISAMISDSATNEIDSKPNDTKTTFESPPDKTFPAETKENASPVLKLPNIIFGMGGNTSSNTTEQSQDSTFQASNNQTVPLNLSTSKPTKLTNLPSNQGNILQRNLDTPDLVVVDTRQEDTSDRITETMMTKSTYVYKKPKQRMLERLLFDSQTSSPSPLTVRSSPGSDSSGSPSRSPYVLPSPVMISSSPPSPPTPPSPPSPVTSPSRVPLNLSTSPMSPYVPIPSQMTSSLSSQSSPVPSPNKVPILTRHSPDDNQNVDLEQSNFAENRLVIDLEQTDEASESVHDSNVKGVNKKLDSKPVSPSNLKSENRSMDTITSAHTSSNPVNLKESKIELQKTSSSMEAPAPILIPLTVLLNDTDSSPNHTPAAVPSQGSFVFAPIKSGEYEDISDLSDADDV